MVSERRQDVLAQTDLDCLAGGLLDHLPVQPIIREVGERGLAAGGVDVGSAFDACADLRDERVSLPLQPEALGLHLAGPLGVIPARLPRLVRPVLALPHTGPHHATSPVWSLFSRCCSHESTSVRRNILRRPIFRDIGAVPLWSHA